MKKCILFLLIIILCFGWTGCKNNDSNISSDQPLDTGVNSTSDVLAAHWDYYVNDNQYMIGPQTFLLYPSQQTFNGDMKYNLTTHTVTPICMDELCNHTNRSNCKIKGDNIYYFIHQNKLYYNRSYYEIVGSYEVIGQDGKTEIQYITETHQCFCSYDLTTGDYRELLDINVSEVETMKRVILYENSAYYLRYFPNKSNPQTVEDYTLSLCCMNLNSGKERLVFDATQFLNQSSVLIFAKDHRFYFANNQLGTLLSIDQEGKDVKILIDGQGENFASFDRYGTFLCGDWIYYAVPAVAADGDKFTAAGISSGYYLFRVHIENGTKEKLSDDLITSFNVTNGYIYYFLSSQQYTAEKNAEANPIEEDCEVIIRIDHDGSNRHPMGYVEGRAVLSWIVKGELYISFFTHGVRFSLSDGKTRNILNDEIIN